MKDEFHKEIYKINNQELPKKASLEDLAELEARLIEQMTDYFRKMSVEYYTKEEINKKLSILSRRLKEASMERSNNGSAEREDGMLTKRHLGPIACAACD